MLDLLKSTEIVLGLVLTAFGLLSGLVVWIDRRQRRRADEAVSGITRDHANAADSIVKLAGRIDHLEIELKEGFDDMETRVGGLERSMETVARHKDVAALDGSVRELRGAMTAEMRAVRGQVDTIYKAALAASQGRKPEV